MEPAHTGTLNNMEFLNILYLALMFSLIFINYLPTTMNSTVQANTMMMILSRVLVTCSWYLDWWIDLFDIHKS
jgi:hypothetical protein